MPKSQRQRRGEILASLRNTTLITNDDLNEALAAVEIESPGSVKTYIRSLEVLGYLIRVAGGWELSEESKATGEIVIKVRPGSYTGDVRRAVSAAIRPFRKIATMELEA